MKWLMLIISIALVAITFIIRKEKTKHETFWISVFYILFFAWFAVGVMYVFYN